MNRSEGCRCNCCDGCSRRTVRVSERLPENGQVVLFFTCNMWRYGMFHRHLNGGVSRFRSMANTVEAGPFFHETIVSHWMPLPEVPPCA